MSKLDDLIALGKAQVGYIEKASNANLDSMTGNKGTNNFTKYSRDVNNWGLAGCQGRPWCATMQFWLEAKIYGVDVALAHWHMTRKTYCGYSVFSTRDKFPSAKRSKTPKLGALIVFAQSHMGRVVGISGNIVYSLEGNTSPATYDRNGGQVKIKTYSKNDRKIQYYLIIDYGNESSTTPSTTSTNKGDTYMFSCKEVKQGEKGTHVYLVQEILRARGIKGADGKELKLDMDCGANTVHAIEEYQRRREKASPGICGGVDGVAGYKTLKDMIALPEK